MLARRVAYGGITGGHRADWKIGTGSSLLATHRRQRNNGLNVIILVEVLFWDWEGERREMVMPNE